MNTCGRIYLDDPATGRTARCGKVAGHDDPLNHGPAPVDVQYTVTTGEGGKVTRIESRPTLLSDGYHTMGELYDHRRALSAALAQVLPSWRSKAHHPEDSPMFEGGYFVVGIDLPNVGTITYHFELRHWEKFNGVDELPHAPRWDGAPPAVTVDRLLEWAAQARS